ncbi:sulfatase family protein [Posidoniimonas polymericola]|nr:sulfatase [Posidoniimonas polymericola]
MATAAQLQAAAPPAASREPLNILLLYADDWRHDTLGVAGNPVVRTPCLDRLAAGGVRFARNCVTTSICGVSRANLLTGQTMSRNGCRGFSRFNTPWAETYPGLLRAAGYHVGHVGKWHNGLFPAERYDFGRSYHGKHWCQRADGSPVHVTQRNEEDALEFLATRPDDKPFCLTVAFFATHAEDHNPEQYLPQPGSLSLYEDAFVEPPTNATSDSWERLPRFFDAQNEGRNRWTWRFDEPDKYQRMMKNYYRLATEVDAVCGRLVEELRRQGELQRTLVIFTTDNGYYHGEHGLADKWYPHQESIRVPLILLDPRLPDDRRGDVSDALTLSIDLAPTMLAAAGHDAPAGMQGEDLAPLYLTSEAADWRHDFFYEHPTIRSKDFIPASEALVERDWKYFYWPAHGVEQLFHLADDPLEEKDLVNDPRHAKRLQTMRTRFAELKAAAR